MDILNDGGYEKMTFENYHFTDFWDGVYIKFVKIK